MAGTITALKAQRHRRDGRVSVYLDGHFAFGLPLASALTLRVGQFLSDEQIAALRAQAREEQVQQRALKLLAFRPRSVAELRQRLMRAGMAAEDVDHVVARLRAVGLLDDTAFAQSWAESRANARPRSRRVVAWELRQKGVSEAEIEAALRAMPDDETLALRLAHARLPRLRALTPLERRRRLSQWLARRGFDYSTIENVLATVEFGEVDEALSLGDCTS